MSTASAPRTLARAAPLHRRLSEEFRRRILDGRWPDGAVLPSEAELCEEFGTSRGPVRQALAALRSEGAVVGGQGRPPQVKSGVPSQPFSTFLSFTAWAHSIGKQPGQRTVELARRAADAETAAALRLTIGDTVVEVLRLRLLDGEATKVERSSFVPEVGRLLFDFDLDSGSAFAHLRRCGVDLRHARHTIDAVAANGVDVELLGIAPGAPLLRERRVTSDSDGRALEVADDRYRPELSSFSVDNDVARPARLSRVHPERHAAD